MFLLNFYRNFSTSLFLPKFGILLKEPNRKKAWLPEPSQLFFFLSFSFWYANKSEIFVQDPDQGGGEGGRIDLSNVSVFNHYSKGIAASFCRKEQKLPSSAEQNGEKSNIARVLFRLLCSTCVLRLFWNICKAGLMQSALALTLAGNVTL